MDKEEALNITVKEKQRTHGDTETWGHIDPL